MKKLVCMMLALALLLAGCASGSQTQTAETEQTAQTEAAPEQTGGEESQSAQTEEAIALGSFTADTLTGETVDQTMFQGHDLTVINIWATYCGPCKEEMPVLGMLARELAPEVQIMGVVLDVVDQQGQPDEAQLELAKELMDAAEAEYPNLILNQDLAMLGFAGVEGVPATLFVDSEGNLVGSGFYGALDETTWRQVIAERLEMAE